VDILGRFIDWDIKKTQTASRAPDCFAIAEITGLSRRFQKCWRGVKLCGFSPFGFWSYDLNVILAATFFKRAQG